MQNYLYIKQNSQIDLVGKIIDFFTSELTNPTKFNHIKQTLKELPYNMMKNQFTDLGYFSHSDFALYLTHQKEIPKMGLDENAVRLVLDSLISNGLLISLSELLSKGVIKSYKATNYAKYLYDRNVIQNLVFGWTFIIDNYSNSVLKIENKNKLGDYSIGTGFYINFLENDVSIPIIVTNKHVFKDASKIRVLTKDEIEINHNSIILDDKRDIGFIILSKLLNSKSFWLELHSEVLSDIITIGYPSIPMTKYAYQVYHKGEINSFIEDYQENKLFIVSAKTSSGNSGSPIIDKHGMVVGIITEELFEKEQFYIKGKLPYYAGIPSTEILKSLEENIFPILQTY